MVKQVLKFLKRLSLCLKYKISFVMIKRNFPPFKGCWALPGGFVEVSESVEQAAIREAKEETGLEVKLVGVYSSPDRDPRRHTISIAFLTKPLKGRIRASEEGEVKWFRRIPEKIAFDHEKILKDVFKGWRNG